MNCSSHPDVAASAFCRTCGKGLCEKCAHSVRGVVYCEDCIARRLQDTVPPAPAAGFAPATQVTPLVVSSGPSPGLAGVLAGFFPFGVGAVYNGQYAKGLAHMLIFVALVWGASSSNSDAAGTFFGLAIAFFYIYQIIDAVRTAHAIRLGQPAPDPFGLGHTFGAGERVEFSQVPVGAIILIGLGILFLLNTTGLFHAFWMGHLWPVILIVLGVWLFMKRLSPPGGRGRA
jgi:TM2 domain-containing membrane protein YozV